MLVEPIEEGCARRGLTSRQTLANNFTTALQGRVMRLVDGDVDARCDVRSRAVAGTCTPRS